jgi:hypothetical protein
MINVGTKPARSEYEGRNNAKQFNEYLVFDDKTFYEQMELWELSNIQNYQYELRAGGYMGYRGIIVVENGLFKDAIQLEEYFITYDISYFKTIDEIYRTIEEEYIRNKDIRHERNSCYLDEIMIRYDPVYHIPISIYYKNNFPYGMVVDGTFSFGISNFIPSN